MKGSGDRTKPKTHEGAEKAAVEATKTNEARFMETKPPPPMQKVLLNIRTSIDGTLLKTPAGRSLTEPPMLNYGRFADERLTSEKKLRIIFRRPGEEDKVPRHRGRERAAPHVPELLWGKLPNGSLRAGSGHIGNEHILCDIMAANYTGLL